MLTADMYVGLAVLNLIKIIQKVLARLVGLKADLQKIGNNLRLLQSDCDFAMTAFLFIYY